MGMGPAASIQTALRTIRAGAAARAEHRAAGGGPGQVDERQDSGARAHAARGGNPVSAVGKQSQPCLPDKDRFVV